MSRTIELLPFLRCQRMSWMTCHLQVLNADRCCSRLMWGDWQRPEQCQGSKPSKSLVELGSLVFPWPICFRARIKRKRSDGKPVGAAEVVTGLPSPVRHLPAGSFGCRGRMCRTGLVTRPQFRISSGILVFYWGRPRPAWLFRSESPVWKGTYAVETGACCPVFEM